MTRAIVEWQNHHEADLRKLVSLINKIVSAVKQFPDKKMEIYYSNVTDILEVRSQSADMISVLPAGLAARWSNSAEVRKEEPVDTEMGM